MKKTYIKPEAETIEFSVEEVLMGDVLDGSFGVGDGDYGDDDE